MDSVIPLGQKNTLAEYMILSGADNRPPMLDKDLYDSWKSRMELYMQNREHGRMILESVENGPLIWPTVEENGVTRTKNMLNCLLLRNSANLREFITDASLPLEWSKFVTDVKLVKDLHTTNFDQLHAYLEQHELHANEVRLLREHQDPLAFVANQQMTPLNFNTYQSSYNNPQFQQQFLPSQCGSIHPTQHYSSIYPSQPQFNHSSIQSSYPYQSQMNHQTSSVPQIAYQSPQVSMQPMIESPLVDSGFAVHVFSPGDDPIACLNKAMDFLIVVASLRFPSTNNQLITSSNPRNQATIQDDRVIEKAMLAEAQEVGQILDEKQLAFLVDPGVQAIIPNTAAFQTEDLDTYDFDCDDILNA
ncbi:hypothetical protein Tco_0066759 [Tanacetum coccineum]